MEHEHDKTQIFSAKELIEKVAALRKGGEIDLSLDEDLSLAVMNLISIEEHFFFTGAKTEKPEYYVLLDEVRAMRKSLMEKLLDKKMLEGETWCISKHLLAAAMRLIEVGTKLQASGKMDEAQEIFSRAHTLYSMFWALRLKLLDMNGFKKTAEEDAKEHLWTMKDITNKLVNCCDE